MTRNEEPMVRLGRIAKVWWPLAFSWLLMGLEGPALSAVIARLARPEINLAAYGGIVYPLSLIIEAPIIMLLAASVALSKDWASYRKVYKFMMVTSAALTVLHFVVAFTPLYDVVARGILGVPAEIVEPGRIGLRLMLPWTWSIAYRRFNQGVLIRFGHSEAVSVGTVVRLSADALVLAIGYALRGPGIVVASGAQALGVMCEAAYVGLRVQPVLRGQLRAAPPVETLTWRAFFAFYIPLALTQLLSLAWQPIGSAALSRMPRALDSLAVYPVVMGLVTVLRSPGIAFNEVVVAVLDQRSSYRPLRKFTTLLAGSLALLPLLITATPLAGLWFSRVSALRPDLVDLASTAFWLLTPVPLLIALQSWFQGAILFGRKTRGIPESLVAFMVVVVILLGAGIVTQRVTGLYVGMAAFSAANMAQTAWLWLRSRPVLNGVQKRDSLETQPELL